MRPATLLAAILASATSSRIAAQEIVRLEPGQRVRVTAPTISSTQIVGAFAHMAADTLVVETDGRAWHFPRASLTRVDVNRGQKSNAGRGALFGFLIGAGIGAVALGSSSLCAETLEVPAGRCALIGAGGGGVGGLLLGTIAGALIKTDRWQEVPVDRLRVSLIPPGPGRFALAMSVSF
jgi:hypothetical protein